MASRYQGYLLSSIFDPPSSVFHPRSSIFHPPFSTFDLRPYGRTRVNKPKPSAVNTMYNAIDKHSLANTIAISSDQCVTTLVRGDCYGARLRCGAGMSPFRLAFLGGFQVLVDGTPITQFRSDKVRALLDSAALRRIWQHNATRRAHRCRFARDSRRAVAARAGVWTLPLRNHAAPSRADDDRSIVRA